MKKEFEILKTELKATNRFDVIEVATGKVIGTRKSKRDYVKALVVRSDKGLLLKKLENELKTRKQYQEKYETRARAKSVADLLAQGWKPRPRPAQKQWDLECAQKAIDQGSYAKYAAESKRKVAEVESVLARVSAGDWAADYPNVDECRVYSFHQSRHAKTDSLVGQTIVEAGVAYLADDLAEV